MIDEPTYNELDRYFHSQMNAGEKAAFESRMNASEELRAELVWLNAMIGGMHQQGRSVMKQTIANAIAGVPMKEVSKYKPSVNGKSFLRKWWWAFAGIAVAVAVAVGAYKYVTRHIDPVHEGSDMPTEVPTILPAANLDSMLFDSCQDEMIIPGDSVQANITEEVLVNQRSVQSQQDYYMVDVDSLKQITLANGYEWQKQTVGGVGKQLPMVASIVRRTQPPYEYRLDATLILYANYITTAGFVFEGAGDTVYMTDNSKQKFMLLRGKGVLPLLPIVAGTKRAH